MAARYDFKFRRNPNGEAGRRKPFEEMGTEYGTLSKGEIQWLKFYTGLDYPPRNALPNETIQLPSYDLIWS